MINSTDLSGPDAESEVVILSDSDVFTETVVNSTQKITSDERLADESWQANGQNQQNYQNN